MGSSAIHSGNGTAESQTEPAGSQAASRQQVQSRGCALGQQEVGSKDGGFSPMLHAAGNSTFTESGERTVPPPPLKSPRISAKAPNEGRRSTFSAAFATLPDLAGQRTKHLPCPQSHPGGSGRDAQPGWPSMFLGSVITLEPLLIISCPLRLVTQTQPWRLSAFGCFYLSASRNLNIPKDALGSLLKYRLVQYVQAGAREAALLAN